MELEKEKKRCEMSSPEEASSMPQHHLAAKKQEALDVIKDDLSQWLTKILKTEITSSTFLDCLDTGVLLCKLVRLIQDAAKKKVNAKVEIPAQPVKCNEKASKESFLARDNTANFISWCRHLGMEEEVIFESEGLVLHKDEKRVILCLLEVARFAERVGVPPPQLVQMEREIDEPHESKHHRKTSGFEKAIEDRVCVDNINSSIFNFMLSTLQVMLTLKDCKCQRSGSPEPLHTTACGDGKFVLRGGNIRGEKSLYARVRGSL